MLEHGQNRCSELRRAGCPPCWPGYAGLPVGAVLDLPRLSKPYLQKQQITALMGAGRRTRIH